MRHALAAASLVTVTVLVLHAQQPAFEVASIKRNVSAGTSSSQRVEPSGRISITNTSIFSMIRTVYQTESFQIVGGPDWIRSDRWDIVAKAPGNSDQPAILAMAKTLLAERFKLVVHNERRDMPVYALVRRRADGPLGPQLQPASLDDCPKTLAELRAFDAAGPRKAPNGAALCSVDVGPGVYLASARTMSDVARVFTSLAGRPVVDQTQLAGRFDLDLKWNNSDEGPSFFTAVQEQLGLKLESTRGPVDVLVIDSAERPTKD